MTNSLNLYATKVFSEQPIALWALDDTIDYLALVSQNDQDLSNWTVTGATVVDATNPAVFSETPPIAPFSFTNVNGVIEEAANSGTITLTSPQALQESDFNLSLGSVAIGAYFLIYDKSVTITFSLEGTDPDTLEPLNILPRSQFVQATSARNWAFVSQTFSLPDSFADLRFKITIEYVVGAEPYEIAINGINSGQWAEEFFLESMGAVPEPLPSNIPIVSNGVPALPYGLEGANGYYLSDENTLYAKNAGLPLVYGAFNSTVIFPHTNAPSLIVPGYGVMNQSGQYKNYTVEFWAKIQSNTFEQRRIFGPIASEDGLYVEGPFLKIKIDNKSASHYVGEWNRPMLINIRISDSFTRLTVNGEEVASFELNASEISFPDKTNELDQDQDWLGFYAYPDVPLIQLDCVGIYPYEVPTVVSKRRFVYGQAVEQPDNIKGLNSTNNVFIDFPFSKTTKTYSYPKIGQWSNGIIENLTPSFQSLSLPSHSLPTIKFNNKTEEEWYSDIEAEQGAEDYFIKLAPNSSWDSTEGYFLFDNLNLLAGGTKSFYGLFELEELLEEEQILFDFINETTGNRFRISLTDSIIEYKLIYKNPNGTSTEEIIYSSNGHVAGGSFLVGLHLPRFTQYYGSKVASFFGTKQRIKMFVGGNTSFANTYRGKFSKIAFCTSRNLKKIESYFSSRGVPTDFENVFDFYTENVQYDAGDSYFGNDLDVNGDANNPPSEYWTDVLLGGDPYDFPEVDKQVHNASYTLIPKLDFGNYILDIGTDSYWEDYIPLSYFAGYVLDGNNEKKLALDFLQFNVDYPKFNVFSDDKFNTIGSPVKTYISFQYLSNGSNSSYSSFSADEALPKNGVVVPGEDWQNKKYEVLEDTVVYPPPGIDFKKLSINVHIEMNVNGIFSNPINIKSLRISSQALGPSPKRIGTRFGTDIVPYRKSGKATDYKTVSPFTIYKGSSPYLYTTSTSGIRIRDDYTSYGNRGLSIPINNNAASFFKISAIQIALKYDEPEFSSAPFQLFELEYRGDTIKFYLVANSDSQLRGRMFAINASTGSLHPGISYYVDGRASKHPILYPHSWLMLGISFDEPVDFGNFSGAFRVTNPIMFNNFSYYQTTEEDEASQFAFRKWFAVRSEPDNPLDWDNWDESLWSEVLFLTQNEPTVVDPAKIYRQYTGTDRVVIESGSIFRLKDYRYSTFTNLKWTRQVLDSA